MRPVKLAAGLVVLLGMVPQVVAQKAAPRLQAGPEARLLKGARVLPAPRDLAVSVQSGSAQLSWTAPDLSTGPDRAEAEPNNRLTEVDRVFGPGPSVIRGAAQVADAGQLSVSFADNSVDDFEDLFEFVLEEGGGSVVLDGLSEDCDLYLLSDASGTLEIVGESFNLATQAESISMEDLSPGTYLIGVSIFDPGQPGLESDYVLTVSGVLEAEALVSYRLYRSESPGASQQGSVVSEPGPGVLTATDTPTVSGTYFYQVTAVGSTGESAPSNEVSTAVTTHVETPISTGFVLDQNWPNPFSGTTTIGFDVPVSGSVVLSVSDLLGRRRLVLLAGTVPSGHHEVSLAASDLAPGLYVYRLESRAGSASKVLTYLR